MEQDGKFEKLSSREALMMKIIWEYGKDIPLQELIERMRQKTRFDFARTTIVTFLGKLYDKGFASSYKIGKTAYIHPEKEEEWYLQELLKETVQFWFDGNTSGLVASLYDSEEISKDDIQKLRRWLDELDG